MAQTMPGAFPQATQSGLVLPALVPASKVIAFNKLTTDSNPLLTHFDTASEKLSVLAECQATFNASDRVPDLERALRDLIDAQRDYDTLRTTSRNVFEAHRTEAGDTPRVIFERTEVAKTNYRDLSGTLKYARSEKFEDFKRRVFDIQHPDDEYPGTESFFKRRRRGKGKGEAGADGDGDEAVEDNEDGDDNEDDDDDMEMTYGSKRNLKCPLTLLTFHEPMRSKLCPHVFSKSPIFQMIKAGRGVCHCPIPGCGQKLRIADLSRDRVMERRVREEEEGGDMDVSAHAERLSDDDAQQTAQDEDILVL